MIKDTLRSDQSFLRSYNKRKIRSILREKGQCSRVELSFHANLDKKTITNIINEMLSSNEVSVMTKNNNNPGRPRENLALNGKFYYCIGIDIGGTHISGVILDFSGGIISEYSVEMSNTNIDVLLQICELVIKELLVKAKMTIDDIDEIGVSIPGHVENKTGKTILAENLKGWENISIPDFFTKKYNKKIVVDDCSRLMALAELRLGAGKTFDDLIVFDLGLGIGCGLVIDRKIYPGSRGLSGEVGHTIVEVDGPLCTCGRHGCIESLASGWALTNKAKDIINKNESSILDRVVQSKDSPSAKEISLAAKLGDEKCIELLKKAGRYIAIGIVNAISIINPSKIIIGGRLIKDNEIIFNEIVKTVNSESIPELIADIEITGSYLGDFASAAGAAVMCLEKFFMDL